MRYTSERPDSGEQYAIQRPSGENWAWVSVVCERSLRGLRSPSRFTTQRPLPAGVSAPLKRRWGRAAYVWRSLVEARRYLPVRYQVEIDGVCHEA